MTGRIVSLALAGIVAAITLSGILLIAVDLFGADALRAMWQELRTRRVETISTTGLDGARDITFFVEARVEGTPVTIHTGTMFSTVEDFVARQQRSRWCYVVLPPRDGIQRHLQLAEQTVRNDPKFRDVSAYPESELSLLGISAERLSSLARTYCRFASVSSGRERA